MGQAPTRRRRRTPNNPPIRVRMYNVGFGDCFLVIFPESGANPVRQVLFDCGTIKQNPSFKTTAVITRLIADIRAEDPTGRAYLDVVVATHRHADHISGFESALWGDVSVGEVWLPWTESDDDDAVRIRLHQEQAARALTAALAAKPRDELFDSIAADATTNAGAVATLKSGFSGDPTRRYLEAAEAGTTLINAPTLPGVGVHLLAPLRNEEIMKAMDPPHDESFLALWATPPTGKAGKIPVPFPNVPRSTIGPLLEEDKAFVRAAMEPLTEQLAFSLDGALNNTSLMIAFAVGDAVLLFPGDAQWGSWKAALLRPESRKLLDRVTFLKVGHHGSHNATPQSFVHDCLAPMRASLSSMISVVPRGKWDIPRQPLVDALKQITSDRTVRSDTLASEALPPRFSRSDPGSGDARATIWVEAQVPY